jgi:hypothetical protein
VSATKYILLTSGLAVAAVAALVLLAGASGPKGAALAARQQAMEALGARIVKLRPRCHVLVLSNPFTQESGYLDEKNQYERAGLRGLRKGLGRRASVKVVFPEIRPEYFAHPEAVIIPPDSRTPLSFLMWPASVDQLAESHPECHVIVSLIGLPVGVDQLRIWNGQDSRCFALLLPDLRLLGPPEKAVEAFALGKLLAAVAEDAQSGDPLIITRDNVVEVLQRQPKALGY